jgi:hypothetical protein
MQPHGRTHVTCGGYAGGLCSRKWRAQRLGGTHMTVEASGERCMQLVVERLIYVHRFGAADMEEVACASAQQSKVMTHPC